MSLVTYLECLPGLALAWLLIIGVFYLGRLISDPYPRPRVRVVVRAPMPQPEPVEDPWSLHDHVLKYFLSPELRGEFANSPNFNNTLIVEAPSGASLPSDFRSLVKQYEQAVLQGTATTNDYRKIETAIRRSLQ